MHGKTALEDIEKYDSFLHGQRYTLRCFCGHNLHKIGTLNDDPILKKNPVNKVVGL